MQAQEASLKKPINAPLSVLCKAAVKWASLRRASLHLSAWQPASPARLIFHTQQEGHTAHNLKNARPVVNPECTAAFRLQLLFVNSKFSIPSLETWLACYRMGNGPRTKNGRKMAGNHFSGGSQMAEKWPDSQNLVIFCLSGHLPGHISAILGTPRNGCRPFCRPFFSRFWFWARQVSNLHCKKRG